MTDRENLLPGHRRTTEEQGIRRKGHVHPHVQDPHHAVWHPAHVGRDKSSTSLGWNLLSSTVIIVLALVNSTVSPAGTSSISTRPRTATLLPVSTISKGLLHLCLVPMCIVLGVTLRRNMCAAMHPSFSVHDIYIAICKRYLLY